VVGFIKKVSPQGFGVIESTDGSKLPFILSDFAQRQRARTGQRVSFSTRRVKGRTFASHVFAFKHPINALKR
jgi:cold shock CspA family protein